MISSVGYFGSCGSFVSFCDNYVLPGPGGGGGSSGASKAFKLFDSVSHTCRLGFSR